jgi:hypothetical protein
MDSSKRGTEKKSSFVLKEFMPQKDKSTNDAVVTLRPNMYATAKSDDTEAKLRKDTVGMYTASTFADKQDWSSMMTSND